MGMTVEIDPTSLREDGNTDDKPGHVTIPIHPSMLGVVDPLAESMSLGTCKLKGSWTHSLRHSLSEIPWWVAGPLSKSSIGASMLKVAGDLLRWDVQGCCSTCEIRRDGSFCLLDAAASALLSVASVGLAPFLGVDTESLHVSFLLRHE
jgi:hypothetical protein